MRCPVCGADSQVLSTREGQYDTTRRRRLCGNGHRFTTVEVYGQVSSQAPHAKQQARRTKRRVAYRRDIDIANALHTQKGRSNELGKKYGLRVSSVYAAARRGRASLQLQRKQKR